MGTAQLLVGTSVAVNALAIRAMDANGRVSVFNTSVALAGLLLVAGALLARRPSHSHATRRMNWVRVAVCYGLALAFMVLLALAARQGLTPAFAVPSGFTMLRQAVLGCGILCFVVAAGLFRAMNSEPRSDYMFWYSLGLGAFAIGLIGVMIQPGVGTVLGWVGRATQYLGGAYMAVAAFLIVKDARAVGLGVPELMAEFSRQAKANYQLLVDTSPYAIISVDGAGRILWWNRAAESMFGYSAAEAIGLSLFGMVVARAQAEALKKELGGRVVDDGRAPAPVVPEIEVRRKDGSQFPAEISVGVARSGRGGGPSTIATLVLRDISERKKIEEARRQSQELFRALSETSPVGVGLSSGDGILLYTNPSYDRILGYGRGELLGMKAIHLYVDPGERRAWVSVMKDKGFVQDVEARLKKKDGASIWVSISASAISYEGKQAVMGTIQDITERKRSGEALLQEQRVRDAIVENAGAMLVYLDSDFNFVLANRPYVDSCGHSWEELAGKNHFVLFPNQENEAIFKRVRDNGEPASFRDKPFVYADQPERGVTYWDWTLVPVKDSEEKVLGLVFSLVDTTERKKAELLKDEFIGMVSHELKTPLTVMIGALSVATDSGVSEEQKKELLTDAGSYAEALAGIVDNLLELSRFQSNRLTLQREPVDVAPLAEKVFLALRAKSAAHRLTLEFPGDTPKVMADPLRVERILYNLVENAIKYSPKGGEVRLFARPEGGHLTVGVTDEGIGISAEDQARLFRSFERINAYETHAIPGLGLGLRVCRILVEAQGGKIWVESEAAKGSTFYFTLPLTIDG